MARRTLLANDFPHADRENTCRLGDRQDFMSGLGGKMWRVDARHGIIRYKLHNHARGGLSQSAAQAQSRDRAMAPPGVDANQAIARL
jgi:hypothetical protein